jgi:hypothetical protein
MPSGPNSKTRVTIAFLFMFVVMTVLSAGVYYAGDLGKWHENIAARESHAALQGITEAAQIDQALSRHPQNKFLQVMARATTAANETNAAIEKLSSEVQPPAISKAGNLGAASRNDLETLRRDLKTAEANATAFMPRYIWLMKSERNDVEKFALSSGLSKETIGKVLDNIDQRHAELTAFTSRMLPARADFYRAYGNYVAILVGEFGAYKVVKGEFIFPFQRTVDRYNAAAQAMTAAAKRVADLEEERKTQLNSQQQRWLQFVRGK